MKYSGIGIFMGLALSGCDSSGYDFSKYEKYKNDGELSDAVHEWVGDYVERYCTVNDDQTISCR